MYLIGFGLISFQPFACESLSELGYPVSDSFSVNMFYWIGGVLGLILTNIASLDGNRTIIFFLICIYTYLKIALGKNGKCVLVAAEIPAFFYLVVYLKTPFHRSPSGQIYEKMTDSETQVIT